MSKKVRVRFAPSPTGGLHLGGVRTVLYNYLFAKQNGGDFIVRIEDTDQTRFVEGAEEYIFNTLEWCGLTPDESPKHGGPHAPYRQSERKESYRKYAEELVAKGLAYYAFDTSEDLDVKRKEIANFQYGQATRMSMKNSLTLSYADVKSLIDANTPYVIRVKLESHQEIKFTDLIRGEVHFDTTQVDDKVLLKADGMPTYHLAVVVDDYAMEISHSFRGEEWLPSAPVHIFLWDKLFGLENMPQWAHLPLILKPDGNGKLSKRDGDRLGFPVFAMDWKDPRTNEQATGFKERGFLPEAFTNMLAMLGWNSGSEQELFSLEELIEKFSLERVHKGGAKFDFEKAKWFNHEWIKKVNIERLRLEVEKIFAQDKIAVDDLNKLNKVIELVKDRCVLLNDFILQAGYFFQTPTNFDIAALQPKWDDKKKTFFTALVQLWNIDFAGDATQLELQFKTLAETQQIKAGELMLPLRVMLVGGKFGPGVFEIASIIGKEETINRIENTIALLA
jgi:glutamyl-tRNA synthetase